VPQCLTEVLVVVVSGDDQDCPAAAQERFVRRLQMTHRFPEPIRSRKFAEYISGDEKNIDLLLLTNVGDAFNCSAKIARSINAAEAIRKMPVSGMEQLHVFELLC